MLLRLKYSVIEGATGGKSADHTAKPLSASIADTQCVKTSQLKWIRLGFATVAVLTLALVTYAFINTLRSANPVGFQLVQVPDGANPPIQVGVWYPTTATPRPTTFLGLNLISVAPQGDVSGASLPLILISHGNGGGPGSHADLALALADSGFVVAAPMHTGDNYADQSAVGTQHWLPDRNRHIHATLEYMLKTWTGHDHLNVNRIGVYGFSAGGFTALTAIGGEPDLRLIAAHCATSPEFVCKLLADAHSPLLQSKSLPVASDFVRDANIKAAVVASPGLGFVFIPNGLLHVAAGVQLWSGKEDVNVPEASNARLVSQALGSRVEYHSIPGAGHFSFLTPCRLFGPPFLCADAKGFDRVAFHSDMNSQVVNFFRKAL